MCSVAMRPISSLSVPTKLMPEPAIGRSMRTRGTLRARMRPKSSFFGDCEEATIKPSTWRALYLNLGRKDGASDREVRDLLTTHAGAVEVSEIDVMNTHTYLNVAPADAERIVAALTG